MPYNLRLAVIITNPIIIEGGVGADFAWSAFGLIGFRFGLFGEDNARVFAGYRALFQDYTDGSGKRDKFQWDVTLYGPVLGLYVQF